MSWWVTDLLEQQGPVAVLATVFWVVASIILHELAHGYAAIRSGDRTPIDSGHMTLNPVVHMGGFGLLMFALLGFAVGAMPVNPRRFRGRFDDAKVALAGPAMNALLALVAVVALVLWDRFGPPPDRLENPTGLFLKLGVILNVVLCLLNLIPVPPLDGATVLSRISPAYRQLFGGPEARNVTLIMFVVVFLFLGPKLWEFAYGVASDLRRFLYEMLF